MEWCHLKQRLGRRFCRTARGRAWLAGLGLLVGGAGSARANSPGGHTTLVTSAVTTGTETFGSHTDHFLDNGILHVDVAANGNVESIKYLKPGSAGTPAANGTQMVSQFGMSNASFGNHYYIYYYWYPDGNGDSVYLGTTTNATFTDLAYKRTYNPATNQVALDMEIHYALGVGNTALYVYLVATHPASYPAFGGVFMQMIWPAAHDSTNFLCEKNYIDTVKTGLSLNGTQLNRISLEPTYYDFSQGVNVTGLPAEVYQMTTGLFAGQLVGKYSYTSEYAKLGAWGRASDVNHVGEWVVTGSHEFMNDGPWMCEYNQGDGLMYFNFISSHYNNSGISVPGNVTWSKTFGPWLLYFNSEDTGDEAWLDAKNQAVAEAAAWPYPWVSNSAYASAAQRATVTGHLVINDPLRPEVSAAGAWVGLAKPDDGTENAPDNWQFQGNDYQYWVQADAGGNFTIPDVRVTDSFGQTAGYRLYAFSAGTSPGTGAVGEYAMDPGTLTAGATKNLGTLTWTVPHAGASLVWEIGIPDRTAAEFKHGDEYAKPDLWANFSAEFTNPLEYNVADGDWATKLNYVHSVDNVGTAPWKWHLNFNLPTVRTGTYWLTIAYAAASSVQVIRVNDDSSLLTTFTPDNAVPGASTYLRQGIHSKYTVAHIAIPSSLLKIGNNTITLDHELHSDHAAACFMYDYIDLEAPPPPPPPPDSGRTITWRSSPPSTAWDNGGSSNFVLGNATNTAFGSGDHVFFDATGANASAVVLTGTLTPNLVTVAGAKNYTFSGNGTLAGAMALTVAGPGSLTVNPTLVALGNCTTTANNATVTVPDTTGLAAGMLVTVNTNNVNGVPDGAVIASITDATHLVLSPAVTRANTGATLNFSWPSTYSGGTDLLGGTLTLGSVNANEAGLGTGPITFDGGTLAIYNWNGSNLPGSGTLPNNFVVEGNGTVLAAQRHTIASSVTGSGNLTLSIPYVRTDLTGDWSSFYGRLYVVTTSSSEGDFRLKNAAGLPQAAVSLGSKVHAYFTGTVAAGGTGVGLGELAGPADAVLQGGTTTGGAVLTWNVGGRSTDATFAGSIGEQVAGATTAINKVGDGTWTLSGTETYTGMTTVTAGTLVIAGTVGNTSAVEVLGDASVELAGGTISALQVKVDDGGTLDGNGTINGALLNDGTVTAGAGQALNFKGNVTNNGTMIFTGGAVFSCSGMFTNNGVLDIISSAQPLPANFINHGTVLDASSVQVEDFSLEGGNFVLTIQSYAGHNYQLQRSDSLNPPVWQNMGAPQAGDNDVLMFEDLADPRAAQRYYRITLSP